MEIQNNINIDEVLAKLAKLQSRIDKQKTASKNWKLKNPEKNATYKQKKYYEKYKAEYNNNPEKKAKHLASCKKYYVNKKLKLAIAKQELIKVK